MTDDLTITFVLVSGWLGFSLPFVILVLVWRLALVGPREQNVGQSHRDLRIGLATRIVLSGMGLVGAFGTAALLGGLRLQYPAAMWVFVAAFIVGVWLGLVLYWKAIPPRGVP